MTVVLYEPELIETSDKQTVSDDKGNEMPACIIKQSQQDGRKSRGGRESRAQLNGLAKVFTAALLISPPSSAHSELSLLFDLCFLFFFCFFFFFFFFSFFFFFFFWAWREEEEEEELESESDVVSCKSCFSCWILW